MMLGMLNSSYIFKKVNIHINAFSYLLNLTINAYTSHRNRILWSRQVNQAKYSTSFPPGSGTTTDL